MMDLPCLDTKTYKKILEESIGRIPSVTNQWTDFNPQDTRNPSFGNDGRLNRAIKLYAGSGGR